MHPSIKHFHDHQHSITGASVALAERRTGTLSLVWDLPHARATRDGHSLRGVCWTVSLLPDGASAHCAALGDGGERTVVRPPTPLIRVSDPEGGPEHFDAPGLLSLTVLWTSDRAGMGEEPLLLYARTGELARLGVAGGRAGIARGAFHPGLL